MDTIADTSRAPSHLPIYHWQSVDELRLPRGCRLVGIELVEDAVELPAFAHPAQAAYVLGPERGVLSRELIARCAHLVRIPTAFSLNVATAGAIVMYDRLRCLGRFATRPVAVGGAPEAWTEHVQGGPRRRRRPA
jgi:tRNA G18 (ribose-2'-O)-methylase SpoU